ncbi:MAG: hypothetical protein ABR572_12790, partial [Cryomorphaceae bacterium]
MKLKTTLAIILFLTAALSKGQDYHPLLENDKVWLEASFVGANICIFDQVYQLRVGGDTLINGESYRKIMRRNFVPEGGDPYCPPFVAQPSENAISEAFIRENVAEKKVYLWVTEDGTQYEEILIYDFNLEAGDTIPTSSYLTDSQIYTVTSVDEVTLQNGESRKRISFSNGGEESSYTEGLGSDKGLYQPFFDGIGFWNESYCIQQNGNNLFGDQDQCALVLNASEIIKGESKLYPNPAVAAFTLELAPQMAFDASLSFALHALDGATIWCDAARGLIGRLAAPVPAHVIGLVQS